MLIVGFLTWCAWLIQAVERERAQVAERVSWLVEAQALQHALGRGEPIEAALRQLVSETATAGSAAGQSLAVVVETHAAAAREQALDGFVRAVRGETAELSQRLGQRWSALYVLALAALLSAATAMALLVVATRRRRRAEALQRSLSEALGAVRQARAAAETASANKTEYVTHMSHELRTPLNAIVGYTALLRELPAVTADPALAADLHRVAMAGEHMLALINGILDIARIEAGYLELKPAPFDLLALITSVLEMLRGQASDGVELRAVQAPELPLQRIGDVQRIRQVLMNLVANALRFTTTGAVVVRVGDAPGGVQVIVEDTGAGISKHGQEKLFRPFIQADGEDARGTGVGLALCKHLVEAMGGTIGVESEVGQGSRFWFVLPLPVA